MNQMLTPKIHPLFTCNGVSYDANSLIDFAHKSMKNSDINFQDLGQFLLNWLDSNDTVEVQTSGTTGISKLLKIKKEAMINSAIATGLFFDLMPGDSALCCLPLKYIAGKMMVVRAMVLGLHLDVVAPVSAPLHQIDKNYDFVAMVPLQVENSVMDWKKIKKLVIGGARLNKQLSAKLLAQKVTAYESYSMTETVTHIALKHIGDACFTTLPNVKISQDSRQCLVIDAPGLNPQTIITNDIVNIVNEYQFIWLGRADNLINSGGVKIFPEKVESKLEGKILQRFFIAGLPDELLGEQVVLVVEGISFELPNFVFENLDRFEKPKKIHFVPVFEETETGKIKRYAILESIKKQNI